MGDGISKLALLWFVYSVTGSPLKTSIIGILQTAPAIVLAPFIGVAVDRLPKKALLILSDLLRAFTIGLVPCWMSIDSFSVASLYVLVVLHAVATAVFTPALTAAVPSLVSRSQYTAANALLQITTSLGIIVGPALSGLGIAALSSQKVLCLNAVTYMISAACFVPIRFAPPAGYVVSRPPVLSTWQDIRRGIFLYEGRPARSSWFSPPLPRSIPLRQARSQPSSPFLREHYSILGRWRSVIYGRCLAWAFLPCLWASRRSVPGTSSAGFR